jgi:hypothetical protein
MQTSSRNEEVTQRYESSALMGSLGVQTGLIMSKQHTANSSRNVMHASKYMELRITDRSSKRIRPQLADTIKFYDKKTR